MLDGKSPGLTEVDRIKNEIRRRISQINVIVREIQALPMPSADKTLVNQKIEKFKNSIARILGAYEWNKETNNDLSLLNKILTNLNERHERINNTLIKLSTPPEPAPEDVEAKEAPEAKIPRANIGSILQLQGFFLQALPTYAKVITRNQNNINMWDLTKIRDFNYLGNERDRPKSRKTIAAELNAINLKNARGEPFQKTDIEITAIYAERLLARMIDSFSNIQDVYRRYIINYIERIAHYLAQRKQGDSKFNISSAIKQLKKEIEEMRNNPNQRLEEIIDRYIAPIVSLPLFAPELKEAYVPDPRKTPPLSIAEFNALKPKLAREIGKIRTKLSESRNPNTFFTSTWATNRSQLVTKLREYQDALNTSRPTADEQKIIETFALSNENNITSEQLIDNIQSVLLEKKPLDNILKTIIAFAKKQANEKFAKEVKEQKERELREFAAPIDRKEIPPANPPKPGPPVDQESIKPKDKGLKDEERAIAKFRSQLRTSNLVELKKILETRFKENTTLLEEAKNDANKLNKLDKAKENIDKLITQLRELDLPDETKRFTELRAAIKNRQLEGVTHISSPTQFSEFKKAHTEDRTAFDAKIQEWKQAHHLSFSAIALSDVQEPPTPTTTSRTKADEVFRGYPDTPDPKQSVACEHITGDTHEHQIFDLPISISDRGLFLKFLNQHYAHSLSGDLSQAIAKLPAVLDQLIIIEFFRQKNITFSPWWKTTAMLADDFIAFRDASRVETVYAPASHVSFDKVILPNAAIFKEAKIMLERMLASASDKPMHFKKPSCQILYDAAYILVKLHHLEDKFVFESHIPHPTHSQVEAAGNFWKDRLGKQKDSYAGFLNTANDEQTLAKTSELAEKMENNQFKLKS